MSHFHHSVVSACMLLSGMPTLSIAETTAAVQVAPVGQTDSMIVASTLVDAVIPSLSAYLAEQMPIGTQIVDKELDLNTEQRTAIDAHLAKVALLVRSAMEQRWSAPTHYKLPPAFEKDLADYIRDSKAGKSGEVGTRRPPTKEVVAAALEKRFKPEELKDIAAFASEPAGANVLVAIARVHSNRKKFSPANLTLEQQTAFLAFKKTKGGAAYARSMDAAYAQIEEQLRLNTMTHGIDIMRFAIGGVCNIVTNVCPASTPGG
jgi:hypothetical protein